MKMELDQLGEEQQEAFDSITNFIEKHNDIAFSLSGQAGTGKSFMILHLVDWIQSKGIDYTLCAPTHKAALVMKQYTKCDANTLHRLLALSPDIAILDLDLRELKFVTSKVVANIPYNGVVICDEASMINDDLFDLLIEKVSSRNSQIVFISDSKQLIPVKQRHYSKVYNLENKFNLTKIYRQSSKNSIVPILQELRDHEIVEFENTTGEDGNIVVTNDMKFFLEKAISEIKISIKSKNVLHTRITAFTNKRIELYNQAVRKMLYDNDKEYNNGEILTAYENGECDGNEYWNSMDYIITNDPELKVKHLPHFCEVKGYDLLLWDPYEESFFKIFMLSKDNSASIFESLSSTIERIRLQAIEAKKMKLKRSYIYWKKYYELINSFCTPINLFYDGRLIRKKSFDYGYACTTHKLQGSSFDNIFVDIKNIRSCKDDLMRRQLQYVALSRTRKDVIIFQ